MRARVGVRSWRTNERRGTLRPLTGAASSGGLLGAGAPGVLRVPQPGGGAARFRLGTADALLLPEPTAGALDESGALLASVPSTTNVLTLS